MILLCIHKYTTVLAVNNNARRNVKNLSKICDNANANAVIVFSSLVVNFCHM